MIPYIATASQKITLSSEVGHVDRVIRKTMGSDPGGGKERGDFVQRNTCCQKFSSKTAII